MSGRVLIIDDQDRQRVFVRKSPITRDAGVRTEDGLTLLMDAQGIILGSKGDGAVDILVGRSYFDHVRAALAPDAEGVDSAIAELRDLFDGRRDSILHPYRGEKGVLFRISAARLLGSVPALYLATHTRESEEEASRLRRAWFALDHASDAVFWVDREGRFEYANESAARMFRYSREDLLTKSVPDLDATITPATWQSRLQEVLKGGGRCESSGRDASGRVFPIEVNLTPLVVDGREYFCAFIRDLSNRKKLEEQFQQAQKMEAVGRLAGGVAHDFNNLLTIINGYTELLLSRSSLEKADEPLIREISEAGTRAAGLTRQLLTFSRRQLVQPVVMDLNRGVGDMEKMLRRLIGEDVRLDFRKDPGLGRIKADPGQIEQVIMNLAVNARDAMPQGGTLALETSNAPADEIRALSTLGVAPGAFIKLTVRDTGSGMDAKTLARLFEPFFTTKDPGKGTGLGLSTVYGIIRSVGGHISCASRLGEGTTFTIYIPECEDQVSIPVPRGVESAPRPGHERILVVEDEPCVRLTVQTLLGKYGYQVRTAASAEEVTRRPRHPEDIPDLVLSDWVMPGMGGPELARWVRSAWPGVPVILVSGYSDREIQEAAGGLTDGFLQKPFTPSALAKKVREVLDRRSTL